MRIEEEIDIWLRSGSLGRVCPREVNLQRYIVNDEVDFYGYIFANKWKDIYSNIFAQWQKAYSKFDTIFIDIDIHEGDDYWSQIEQSYEEMQKVRDILLEEGLEARWYYTGRCFHAYIDFPVTHLEYYTDIVRYYWAVDVFNDVDSVDVAVVGDKNRMARIVGSVHGKTGLRMIRIEPEWELDKIVMNSMDNKNEAEAKKWFVSNAWFAEFLKELNDEYMERVSGNGQVTIANDERKKNVYEFMTKHGNSIECMPPCIKEGINLLLQTGELYHEWRFHLATYLLRVWDRESVEHLFSLANDYKPGVTKYQLDYIEKRKLYPFGCKKAKLYGICQFDDQRKCPFHDLLGKWIGSVFKDLGV